MKIALYQGPSPCGDMALAFEKIESMLSSAACAGADMVVFPELFLPGYNQPGFHQSMSQPKDGPWEQDLAKLAIQTQCAITIGWAERDNDAVYNAASCFDKSGAKIAHYRKRQLFGPMEKNSFEFGDAYSIFDFAGSKLALLICYDVEFAPHVEHLRSAGVKLILVPTANPVEYPNVAEVMVRARAMEAGVTIVYANLCGQEQDLTFGGKSLIVGPDGEPLARAGIGETLLITELSVVDEIDPMLISTQSVDYRKPEGN